jgi:threonine/homoserine/homoserine lactone efflux protein
LLTRGDAYEAIGYEAAGFNRVTALREGLVANLTNPSPIIFMLAFLPQFVDPSRGSITLQLVMLGAIQKAMGFAVLALTALASGSLGVWIARRRGLIVWQRRFTGLAMVSLGLSLAARARS